MLFPQALEGVWRILGGWRWSGWLWCCGRSCWWCSRCMTKRSSPAGSGRGEGAVREGYKVVALLLKPSLGLFGLVGQHRVLLPHPGSANGHLIAPGDHHTTREFHQWFLGPLRWTPWSRSSWQCPQPLASVPPPLKGRPMHWAVPSSVEPSEFAFWGCWQWSCCHNLDR